MSARSALESAQQTVIDALTAFLAAPPAGTPPEVIAVLTQLNGHSATALPPRLFFAAVEQAPVAISITDPAATILYANLAFEALTGYDRADIYGKNESILSNNATPPSVYAQLWHTISNKHTWSGTLVNRTKQGGDYLAELIIAPVFGANGELQYFLGMHRDVTKVHELEGALRQQKARLETVLDAAPVVMALLDSEGRVILDNQDYKQLLHELHGREPVTVLQAALDAQLGSDAFAACLDGRNFKHITVSLEIPGQPTPRWFSCSGTRVEETDPSARSYFGQQCPAERRLLLLANDVTAHRREIERAQLEHLRASLAEQQLMHGMREALAAAIYQIQGPLNVINAAAGMLRSGAGNVETLATTLDQISISGSKALATLRAALPEEPREIGVSVNINALLRQVLELETGRLLATGVIVDWQPATVLPELPGHQNQLRSLFKHLLDNAIQALQEARPAQRELRLTTRRLERGVEIEIQDNGHGIAPEERYRVFEPFYVGWRDRRGRAGMGLALAQAIATAHGGSLSVDVEHRGGCLMRVALTAALPDE
ncbi:nitrogen fixation negative regulator NifL [Chromatium okenii]|uniref:nitrogen fixation negative regulator NifL n=1 Tax=Chromatium okenii TaxID=61644 RepID=UPI001905DAB1|nr:nitrogen fixation negative regulator NifL [Chromatium okenii]